MFLGMRVSTLQTWRSSQDAHSTLVLEATFRGNERVRFSQFEGGGLWQSGVNEFLPCPFFLYVPAKRYDEFLALFPDRANITGKLEFFSTRARCLRNPKVVSLKHNRFMLHASPYPKATQPKPLNCTISMNDVIVLCQNRPRNEKEGAPSENGLPCVEEKGTS